MSRSDVFQGTTPSNKYIAVGFDHSPVQQNRSLYVFCLSGGFCTNQYECEQFVAKNLPKKILQSLPQVDDEEVIKKAFNSAFFGSQ